ncbi:MAG: class I SAM-dependent methyltransferase [Microthrixaceae bacterium]
MTAEFGGLRLPAGVTGEYFVEWRPRFWGPVVAAALESAGPLDGRRVLELGPRSGRISSLLAYNGAHVVGAELDRTDLSPARAEAARWGVTDRVELLTYSGLPFDVVVSKSVLVVVPELPDFFAALAARLSPDGCLVCAENRRGGLPMRTVRRLAGHQWVDQDHFSGVGPEFISAMSTAFGSVDVLRQNPLACALRARP